MSVLALEERSPRQRCHLPVLPSAPRPRPLGFWGSLGALTLSCVVGFLAVMAFVAVELWGIPAKTERLALEDYATVIFMLAAAPVLVWAIRRAGWRTWDYLALHLPRRHDVLRAVKYLAVFLVVELAVTYAFGIGQADDKLMADTYRAASLAGTLPLLWLGTVVIAPISEEIVFRGFLYRGWAHSRLGAMGAILVISVIFGLLHQQYTWAGIISCAFAGLLLGWARWRSGTTTLPILLHFLVNLTAMISTAATVAWS